METAKAEAEGKAMNIVYLGLTIAGIFVFLYLIEKLNGKKQRG